MVGQRLTADLTATKQAAMETATEEETAVATLTTAEQQQTAQQIGAALRRWMGAQQASTAVTSPRSGWLLEPPRSPPNTLLRSPGLPSSLLAAVCCSR